MRKLFAVAILICSVAPAFAERGFINGLGNKSSFSVSKSYSYAPTEQQKQRHKPFWDKVVREREVELKKREIERAEGQADQATASSRDAQNRRNKAKDALQKLLDSRRL